MIPFVHSFINPFVQAEASVMDRILAMNPYVSSEFGTDPLITGREVQQGQVFSSDGVSKWNNYTDHADFELSGDYTISFWFKTTTTSNDTVLSKWDGSGSGSQYLFNLYSSGSKIRLRNYLDEGSRILTSTTIINDGEWHHVVGMRVGSTLRLYINNVLEAYGSVATTDVGVNAVPLRLSGYGSGNGAVAEFRASDLRLYSDSKTDDQLNALFNGEVDTSDLVMQDNLDTLRGSTTPDVSGNGHDGTLQNGATIITDNSIPTKLDKLNNWGFTDDSGTIVPMNLSDPTKDTDGNALQFTGSVFPVVPKKRNSFAGVFDGVDDKIAAAHLGGTETVVSSGGTSTPTVGAGEITFTAGTCWDLLLSDGTRYTFSNGEGITVHDVSGNGNHGTIQNATTTPAGIGFWAGRQDDFHWNADEGFTFSGTSRIPALADSSDNAADGSGSVSNPAGDNNAETELEVTYIAEGGNRCPATNDRDDDIILFDLENVDDLQALNPINSTFRRDTSAIKKDRLTVFPETLVGNSLEFMKNHTS